MEGGFRAWKEAGLPVGAGFAVRPLVKCFYDAPTGTCQYIVIDEGAFNLHFMDADIRL